MNPNPRFDTSQSTESIRSDIDSTRQRMDAKTDAIGERLKGRHIIDEVVGYFRSKNGSGSDASHQLNAMKEKITESAGQAVHSVVGSVKAHPLPSILIGAGVAWLIYENARSKQPRNDYTGDNGDYHHGLYESHGYAEDSAFVPEGFEREPTGETPGQSTFQGFKQRASGMKQSMQAKASQVGEKIQQGAQSVQQRAGEIGSRVQERAQEVYAKGRQQVSATAENHPVELGLGLLGLGLILGLALPTPQKVNQLAGPTADRLRRRVRDGGQQLVEQGKHVVQAAGSAARQEAENQGLTPGGLRQKVTAVAQQAKGAAQETAQQEGVPFTGSGDQPAPRATRDVGSNI